MGICVNHFYNQYNPTTPAASLGPRPSAGSAPEWWSFPHCWPNGGTPGNGEASPWENLGKTIGQYGEFTRKPWENHRKIR